MYFYRQLQSTDIEIICSLPNNEDELYFMFPKATYPLTIEQFKDVLKDRIAPTVILYEDKVVAYANFYNMVEDSCWLGNVIVSSHFRGKGVSQFLIEVMEKIANTEYGKTKLKLVCHNTNTRGILFYKKHGYIPFDISKRMKRSGEYVAGIHMEKKLAPSVT